MTNEVKGTSKKYAITFVVALIPEVAFSWLIGRVLDTSIWYVWIGIQIIKLVLWLVRSAIEYALFHLLWKSDMIDSISSSLALYNYPNPTKYIRTALAQDFFYNVMTDDELEMKTRLDGAQTHSLLANSTTTQGFLRSFRMDKVFTEGIRKYHEIKFSGKDYNSLNDQSIKKEDWELP